MGMIYFITIALSGLAMWVSYRLRSKFKEYAQYPLQSGLSGAEVAKKMLNENGIYDVQVVCVPGELSDHYNPANKTVNLSPEVYEGRHVAAAAVAAHECGHAVQHATAYFWLGFRSKVVPAVSFASKYLQWVLLLGVLAVRFSLLPLGLAIALFTITTIFSIITLPVEFDASNRALKWLESANIATGDALQKAKNALTWAASTYVIAAITSVLNLLYYVSIFLGARRREN